MKKEKRPICTECWSVCSLAPEKGEKEKILDAYMNLAIDNAVHVNNPPFILPEATKGWEEEWSEVYPAFFEKIGADGINIMQEIIAQAKSETLKKAIEVLPDEMEEVIGAGYKTTFGDTDFANDAVTYGYNLAREEIKEKIEALSSLKDNK
jgi:hypothetical protein